MHINKRFHSIGSETLQDFPDRYLFRWRADKAQAYTAHIEGDVSNREAFEFAVTDQDTGRACTCLKFWIVNAARHPGVGMIALRPRSQQMVRNKGYKGLQGKKASSWQRAHTRSTDEVRNRNHKRPEWFNDVCTARKKSLLIALKAGQAKHACDQLHRDYRAEAQRAKQQYTRTPAADFMCKLFQKDPVWRDIINNLFNHPSPSYNDTHGSHPRSDWGSLWTPSPNSKRKSLYLSFFHGSHNGASGGTDPHPSNLPGEVELTSLFSTHISNMSNSSSPGFDTVLPPFIKHACILVPRHHGRGFGNYDVLAPYILQL
eukprot:1162079-Pelagomonas_calceolata.AAC.4